MQAGKLAAARAHLDRALQVRKGLANADPTSAQASFDVVQSHCRLAQLAMQGDRPESLRGHLETANIQLTEMDHRGQIAGFTQRQHVQKWVQDAIANLPTRKPQK